MGMAKDNSGDQPLKGFRIDSLDKLVRDGSKKQQQRLLPDESEVLELCIDDGRLKLRLLTITTSTISPIISLLIIRTSKCVCIKD